MLVDVEAAVPFSYIRNGNLVNNMAATGREIEFYINNMFITEPDSSKNQVRCNVGQKEKVNITVTGQIKNDYMINDFRILKNGSELWDKGITDFNLKNRVLNITYYNVRVMSVYDYDNHSHTRKLYVDTSHNFYDFLRPILVNHELIDINETGNLKIKPKDIINNFNGLETLKAVGKRDYNSACKIKYYHYQVKCKKGDNDGD